MLTDCTNGAVVVSIDDQANLTVGANDSYRDQQRASTEIIRQLVIQETRSILAGQQSFAFQEQRHFDNVNSQLLGHTRLVEDKAQKSEQSLILLQSRVDAVHQSRGPLTELSAESIGSLRIIQSSLSRLVSDCLSISAVRLP